MKEETRGGFGQTTLWGKYFNLINLLFNVINLL